MKPSSLLAACVQLELLRLTRMEDLDDYISSGSQRKAAMTLDDLSLPSFVQDVDVESTTTDGGGLEFSRDPNDYKKELTKLLRKSRGTPYEKTLRKFVETKLREISKDIFEKSKPDPASKVINSIAQQRTEGSPVRASLASLSTSKYDDANYSTVGRFRLAQQQTSENKIRLDEMARPLDRHKYKVTVVLLRFELKTYVLCAGFGQTLFSFDKQHRATKTSP